jgi:CheY-like chemotaxis protein
VSNHPDLEAPKAGKGSLYRPLLIIEDSDEDFEAFKRMIKKAAVMNPLYRCADGDEALDFLYHTGDYQNSTQAPRPSLILLDLNLPGTDGRELLSQIKQDKTLKSIPIVVFTTSSNPKDVELCYFNGANGYMLKPVNVDRLRRFLQTFIDYWFEVVLLPGAETEEIY